MEELIVKLEAEQKSLMESMFENLPSDYAGVMRRWAEWYGLGKAIAFIKDEERRYEEDTERD